MKSALLRLREARDSLSATERSIADYLLSHPEEAMELSIHEMAELSVHHDPHVPPHRL